uniref:Uncharacterized protein n=1 Tax=Panagrolaimus davidi TaxID=227884 RepID=A0A914P9T9_9BILA
MAYTLEAVGLFENRLFINTILTIIFNGLAVYLILKHSATVMGNYKCYILSTVIFAFLMDFHLSFIWGMFPLYPYPGVCPAGIAKHFGQFWGGAVQYVRLFR